MYAYMYRVEWTLLKRTWFVFPTRVEYVRKQKAVIIVQTFEDKKYFRLRPI